MFNKKRILFSFTVLIVFIVIFITIMFFANSMQKKSMFATRCKFVTVSFMDNTYKLNNSEKKKMLEMCENNNWVSGKADGFNVDDNVYREAYNVIVDFNNDIVKLYVNTETAQIKMSVSVSDRENSMYYIADNDFIDFINSMVYKAGDE